MTEGVIGKLMKTRPVRKQPILVGYLTAVALLTGLVRFAEWVKWIS